MTAITRASAKSYFITGARPTQAQFADVFDSTIFQVGTSAQTITSDVSALGKVDVTGATTLNALTVANSALTTLTGNLTVAASSLATFTGNVSMGSRAKLNTTGQSSSGSTGTLAIKQITGDKTILINGTDAVYTAAEFQTNASALAGFIQVSGATTNYVTTSDGRKKEAVEPLIDGAAKVDRLRPVSFRWKTTGRQGHGFIAQDVEKIIPEAVSWSGDTVGIDNSRIVPYLVAKVQDLEKRVAILETKKE